jgi:UDP-N-acetylglucosamine 2-epimerase (non-hydrolysing)
MYNILVATGTRADFWILKPLLELLQKDKNVNLTILATAMHLEPKYGDTYKQIEVAGFTIDCKISMNLVDTQTNTICQGLAKLTSEFANYLNSHSFDICIILGDRYEMLAIANCCLLYRLPIAHFHGGELTLGNYDESIRHALTKFAHLHFASTEAYKKRILQLGENKDNVINCGAMGVFNVLENLKATSKKDLDFLHLSNNYAVVLFHPETLLASKQINTLLQALKEVQMQYIFIASNSDNGSDEIMQAIRDFIKNDSFNSQIVTSLENKLYHRLIKESRFLIGNSSSGIIEAPSLGVWTINIGNRQKGRIFGATVLNCQCDKNEILKTIDFVLNHQAPQGQNPYLQANSPQKAYQFLMQHLQNGIPKEKEFVDL